jgi:hypothetical protein
MSRATLIRFLERVREDSALQKDLAEFAVRHGFELTPADLSDVQLDRVVGGLGRTVSKYIGETEKNLGREP